MKSKLDKSEFKDIVNRLGIEEGFTGKIILNFNQGGVTSIKIEYEIR